MKKKIVILVLLVFVLLNLTISASDVVRLTRGNNVEKYFKLSPERQQLIDEHEGIALYEGEVFSGLANGNGKLILRDGSWIEAYWEKGKKLNLKKPIGFMITATT